MNRTLKSVLICLIGLIIIYPAVKPFFSSEFFHLHDFTHVARLAEMDRAIQDGHFPVRWSQNFGFGYGMPLFNFYGPTPFYIAEGFHLLGFSLVDSIKIIFILTFFVGFIAMFFLSKRYFGVWGGLISATAFTYAPYRAVDSYVRGAVNELFGITFITLSMLALSEYKATRSSKWIVAGALFLFGIVTSHNISALFAFPALAVFGVILWFTTSKQHSKQTAQGIIGMFILSFMLSAFYALPAFMEKSLVGLESITSGYFHYSQHFLYLRQFINSPFGYGGSIYGLEDGLSFEIGKVHIVLFLIGLATVVLAKKQTLQMKIISIGVVGMLGVSILMATFKTQFLWDQITLLQYIQFPWRFLSLIIIFISFLCGATILSAEKMQQRKPTFALAVIILLILFNQKIFVPENYLNKSSDLYYGDANRIQSYVSSVLPDYNPKGLPLDTVPPKSRFEMSVEGLSVPLVPTINRTHEFLVEVPIKQKTRFTANIFAFKGWQLYINDNKVDAIIGSPLPTQSIDLDPQTLHTDKVYISGVLESTSIQQVGNWLSIAGLIVSLYIWKKASLV